MDGQIAGRHEKSFDLYIQELTCYREAIWHADLDRLARNPYLGGFIAENHEKIYRELIQGNYRVIYRTDGRTVHVITIRHAARLLDVDCLD